MSEERGKLDRSLTIKCDDALLERFAAYQSRREALTGASFSRSVLARILIEEAIGARETPPVVALARARE